MQTTKLKIIFIVIFLFLTSCFTTTPIMNPMSFSLYRDYPTEQIEKAIQHSAADKKWNVEKMGDGKAILNLRVRRHQVRVRVSYSEAKLEVYYLDSEGMRYDGFNIHKKYHMWVDRLVASIKKRLLEYDN